MADTKTSALAELTAADAADLFMAVDVSDTLMAASGTNKKITVANLFKSVPAGAVGTPGIAFDGDADTGLFSTAADDLSITVGGVEAFRAAESAGSVTWEMDSIPVRHPTYTTQLRIGAGSTASTGTNITAIGVNAVGSNAVWQNDNVSVGYNARCLHGLATAIGANSTASGSGGVAIGSGASASSGVAIGYQASNASGTASIGVNQPTAGHGGGIAIGNGIGTSKVDEFAFGNRMSGAGRAPSLGAFGSTAQYTARRLWGVTGEWVDSTDAARKSRVILQVHDFNVTEREFMRGESSGTAPMIGFLGATAVIQQATTGETVGFTAGAGTGVNDDSTFTGNVGATAYRISDIVKALKNYGLLAQ